MFKGGRGLNFPPDVLLPSYVEGRGKITPKAILSAAIS